MKRIDNSDVNIKLESKLVYLQNFNAKFYTVNPQSFFIRKTQDDVFTAETCTGVADYYIKLDWSDLVTMGKGVLQYQITNNIPDEDRADLEYNSLLERTTEYYVNSDVTVDPETESSITEVIAELEEKIDAEITRSTSAYTVISGEIESKQDELVSGVNIKTINDQSILGSGNLVVEGNVNVIESITFNNNEVPVDANKNAAITYTETDPTVPSWAKTPNKPTYTANEVGAIPNAELFYGDIRQTGFNYINHFGDALWAANKRFTVTCECYDANNNPISPKYLALPNLFNLNYEGQAVTINSGGEKAIITIKKGDDLDAASSRFFSYGQGYIYAHFYSAVDKLPQTITGRVYVQHQSQGWQPITFVQMENPNACYRAEITRTFVYPSALEITFESKPESEAILVELEWFTERQNEGDVPVFSKARAETLYQPLTLKEKLIVNDKVEASRFVVSSSNNNYLLLGGGNTKPISDFALASSLSSYYTKTEIDNLVDAETTRATNAESALSTSIESKYSKPSGGIPKSDLASSVQTSLGLADTALQSFTETDPTVPAWAKAENKPAYTADEINDTTTANKFVTEQEKTIWNNKSNFSGSYNDLTDKPTIPTALSQLSEDSTHRVVSDTEKTTWNNKQNQLVSGVNIKTINSQSIIGSGNIEIQGGGSFDPTQYYTKQETDDLIAAIEMGQIGYIDAGDYA